uniref:Uncharacterized protein n=1 Tax=Panagrolaimus sp. PS1159 TaxID=55785 RepID=A0AC35EYK8_9BILA
MTRRHDAARKDRRKRHVATAEEALYSVEAILRAAAESQAHEERQDQRANGAEAGTPNPDADDEDANQGQQAGNGEEEEGQQAGNGEEEE